MHTHELITNNESRKDLKLTYSKNILMIDLTFPMPNIDTIETRIIDVELLTLPGHKLTVCDLADVDMVLCNMRTSQEVTGWSIKIQSEDDKKESAVA